MLGDIVQKTRKNKGWTQEYVAKKLFVTKSTISKWEKGQSAPSINMLPMICDLFGISMNELLEYKPSNNSRTVWVMELFDTDASAVLSGFSEESISCVQKHIRDVDFLCFEKHLMKEDLCIENTIYWVTNDEVCSFKAGDRKACEEAIERLRKKGISIS